MISRKKDILFGFILGLILAGLNFWAYIYQSHQLIARSIYTNTSDIGSICDSTCHVGNFSDLRSVTFFINYGNYLLVLIAVLIFWFLIRNEPNSKDKLKSLIIFGATALVLAIAISAILGAAYDIHHIQS